MIAEVATCRRCRGLYVSLKVVPSGADVFVSFHCGTCGNDTPARTSKAQADKDVDWTPCAEAFARMRQRTQVPA